MTRTIAPWGAWESPLGIGELFARPSAPMHPCRHRGVLYWIEAIAAEGGRMVLMREEGGGRAAPLTPLEFNIRSRVHEYGGKCFCLAGDEVVFSNFDDGRLYRQRLEQGATPRPLTPETGIDDRPACYVDLQEAPGGEWLLCVAEIEVNGEENRNLLACIDLRAGEAAPRTVAAGADFYAAPTLSPAGDRLAWLEWDHPRMPWDETRLMVADLDPATGSLAGKPLQVAGGPGRSVCQPRFGPDGALLFAMDADDGAEAGAGFWNLYRWRAGETRQLTRDRQEYGEPLWVFGERRYAFSGPETLAAARTGPAGDQVVAVDAARGGTRLLEDGFAACGQFWAPEGGGDEVLFIAGRADREAALARLDVEAGTVQTLRGGDRILAPEDTSLPEAVSFPTRDGEHAHGWFHPPVNSRFAAPPGTRPPLVVMVHGGPTSRATGAFSPLRQHFTTLGFAVLDVNHRGSTGYGRRYRQALLGRWGEIDADDIADAVGHVAGEGRVDGERVFIRGGSAGGYAVLRALTRFPELFRGGACYYGIGNLITLARLTHKFEAHYTDELIGEKFDPETAERPESRYHSRSPIFFMDRIRSPLILFQGLEDKVVPPELSREVVRVLERNGVLHEYVEYPGEGHGFRGAATRVDSLQREVAFYRRLMGLKGEPQR